MGKDIEKLLKDNLDRMDVENPSDQVWEGIRKNSSLLKRKPDNTLRIWQIAASILLVFSLSLLFFLSQTRQDQELPLATLGDVSDEYRLIENQYEESINSLYSSLDMNEINKEEYEWLFKELDYLDSLNLQFREDIGDERNQELLVEILVDYYEKKLKLLRRLELEINRKNNENDESINI